MTPSDEQIIAHQAKTSAAVRRLVEECERLRDQLSEQRRRIDTQRDSLAKRIAEVVAVTAARDELADKLESWVVALPHAQREPGLNDVARLRKVGKL